MSFSRTIQALSDPTRRKILEILKSGESSAGALADNFSISRPSLSHHLSVLKEVDLVSCRRRGQELLYSLNLSVFEEVAQKLLEFFKN